MHFKSLFPVCLVGQAAFAVGQTITSPSAASASKTLPPSPTGSGVCEPHDDHWHCHPTSTSTPTTIHDHDEDHAHGSDECTPHDDHWHCPPGVPTPTAAPDGSKSGKTATSGGSTLATKPVAGTNTSAPTRTTTATGLANGRLHGSGAAVVVSIIGAIVFGTMMW